MSTTSFAQTKAPAAAAPAPVLAPPVKPPVPVQTEHEPAPDLATQLERATRLGHHVGDIHLQARDTVILQPKLRLGPVGDRYEQEADHVASLVVQRLALPTQQSSDQAHTVQRQTTAEKQDEESVQRQAADEKQEEEPVQTKAVVQRQATIKKKEKDEQNKQLEAKISIQRQAKNEKRATIAEAQVTPFKQATRLSKTNDMVHPGLEELIHSARGGGQSLADSTQARMEKAFGADFSHVKIHTDVRADALNHSLDARSFTTGHDIFFRHGEYNPESTPGQQLLAHELTHVLQQSGRHSALQRSHQDHLQPAPYDLIQATLAPASLPAQATVDKIGAEPTPNDIVTQNSESTTGSSTPVSEQMPVAEAADRLTTQTEEQKTTTADTVAEPMTDVATTNETTTPNVEAGPEAVASATASNIEAQVRTNESSDIGASSQAVTANEGEISAMIAPVSPETQAGDLETSDLVLIDLELAEHQRWAGALGRVGEVASLDRAGFVAEAAGSGLISGAASGLGMGLVMGLATRAVPAIGPIIGGGMALHGIVTRDWAETRATVARFGQGSDTYEKFANTIASVAAVIDVVSQILNVINGIVGIVQIAAIALTAGATVATVLTLGAAAPIAIEAGSVAAECIAISKGITAITTVLDGVNAGILQPCVVLFRALHAFTTQADPREVEAQGRGISSAAAASGAALGAWAGGKAAHAGTRPRAPAHEASPSQRPAHETPPPVPGEGPTIHFQEPVTPTAHAEIAPSPAAHAEPAVTPAAATPATVEAAPATHPERAPAPAAHTEPAGTPAAATPAPETAGTGMRIETHGTPTGELRGMTDADIDTFLSGVDSGSARSGTFFELPGQNPRTGAGLQAVPEPHINPNPSQITYSQNLYFSDVGPVRIANAADVPIGAPRGPSGSIIPEGVGVNSVAPQTSVGGAPPTGNVEVRYHSANPNAPAGSYSAAEPTVQVNTPQPRFGWAGNRRAPVTGETGRYLLPDGRWVTMRDATPDEKAAAHWPVGSSGSGSGPSSENPPPTPVTPPPSPVTPSAPHASAAPPVAGAPSSGGSVLPHAAPETPTAHEPSVIIDEAALGLAPGSVTRTGPTVPREPAARTTDVDWSRLSGSNEEIMARLRQIEERPEQQAYGGSQTEGPYRGELGMTITDPHTGQPIYKPEAFFDITPDQPTYGVRAGLGGAWVDHVFTSRAEAEAYAAQQAAQGEAQIRSQSALPHGWPADAEGKVWPGNPVDRFGVFEVPPNTPNIRSVVAPQPEGSPAPGRPGVYPGGGPQTQLPAGIIHRGSIPDPAYPIPPAGGTSSPPTPSVPVTGGPAPAEPAAPSTSTPVAAPEATTSNPMSTWSAARGAAQSAVPLTPGGPRPETESPTLGTRAHQVGELFLPQVFGAGGEPPTYAQQQAAHRARFTADNQPAEGVERVNPNYSPPPATPAQITAIQNEIVNLLATRARAEQEAQHQSERADRCEANQGPIRQTVEDTKAGISAVQAHDEAIARREAVNQEQQQRQQEAQALTAGYPSRATGLTALTVPLAKWESFTSFASHLPGAAGDKMLQMNREAQQMQKAFAQIGAEMRGVDKAGPAREAELQYDQGRLENTKDQAQSSKQELHAASTGAQGLQNANEAALAEAAKARDTATEQAQQLGDAAAQREEHANSLAEQLRVWAVAHKSAREQAIEATVSRLQGEGKTIVGSTKQ